MNRLFYNVLLLLISPLLPLRLLWRSVKAPAYRKRIGERFGSVPEGIPQNLLWVHAVSVGETVACEPLVKALLERYPEEGVLVTTMTPTGSAQVERSFKGLLGERVYHCYAPYDMGWCLRRFLTKLQPKAAVIMETELWPNTLHLLKQQGIPVVLANARLSASSAKGYARLPALVGEMLGNLDAIAVQHQDDGQRFVDLGFPEERLHVTGSVKFDYQIDAVLQEKATQLSTQWQLQGRHVWIAASTHKGEDEYMLAAHQQLLQQWPDALLILVPRHPERFDDVASLVSSEGFSLARRSKQDDVSSAQVLLGDTMGELTAFFGVSQQAFVGGSLVETGGHNPIEPAAWEIPVFMGPHVFNFAAISAMLVKAGGMRLVANANMLAEFLAQNWSDTEKCNGQGEKALAVVEENRGALDKQLAVIAAFI
jgi:3-deoxy-D-manno-octulosonic-acid transferase